MADIKINLLPWREELREEKKQEFLRILVSVVVFAGVIVFGVDRFYNNSIDTQNDRNSFLTSEIKVLEEKISEIKQLQKTRNELLSRMQVIQELQGNRPIIVRLFDELARKLSDRVFFQKVVLKGKAIAIQGVAESNNRISSQLRNFEDSAWFTTPNVTAIKADTSFGPQASKFSLSVSQATPVKEGEAD
ncbi:MAG: PilN domain-containing protein [bacterium]|nr:pilus assembly protein PilN [Gammaproteobacteria bacterium]HIL97105.1 pilus assembly protein PilN [Pseudomonadales bacterium]